MGKRKTLNVIILKSKTLSVNTTQQLISTAEALTKSGHNVTLFTTDPLRKDCEEYLNCDSYNVAQFIPRSIYGRFKKHLNFIKTLYTALYISVTNFNDNSKAIVAYNPDISIPVLNIVGNFPVIYFHHLDDKIETHFEQICVQNAGQVLVASQAIKNQLIVDYPDLFQKSKVMHYCVETKIYRQCVCMPQSEIFYSMDFNSKFFVSFGSFTPNSKHDLCVQGFILLLQYLKKGDSRWCKNLFLVLASANQNDSGQSYRYMRRLQQMVLDAGMNPKQLLELRGMRPEEEKSLMSQSVAVLMPRRSDLRQLRVLRAMHANVPVIAVDKCAGLDLLKPDITGLVVPAKPVPLSYAMEAVLQDVSTSNLWYSRIKLHYNTRYSFTAYQIKLNHILHNCVSSSRK